MIVVYALGGGLGHVTRSIAVLHTLRERDEVAIIASSALAGDPRVHGEADVVVVPPEVGGDRDGLAAFVRTTVAERRADHVVVDAFPDGVLGELRLGDPHPFGAAVRMTHVARALRWERYVTRARDPASPAVTYDTAHLVEPVPAAQLDDLRARSGEVTELVLRYPLGPPRDTDGRAVTTATLLGRASPGPPRLVVHAGPASEIAELVAYATDRDRADPDPGPLVVVTPDADRARLELARAGAHDALAAIDAVVDVYPAWPLFAEAARVYSAAGCNVVAQAAPWRDRHRMVPFDRPLDDQYARAARARRRS